VALPAHPPSKESNSHSSLTSDYRDRDGAYERGATVLRPRACSHVVVVRAQRKTHCGVLDLKLDCDMTASYLATAVAGWCRFLTRT